MRHLGPALAALLLPLAVACGATVEGDSDADEEDGACGARPTTPCEDSPDADWECVDGRWSCEIAIGGPDDGSSDDGASDDGSPDDGSSDDGASDDGGCTPCECGVNPPLCGEGHAPAPACDENGEWICAPYTCPTLVEPGEACDVEGLLCDVELGCDDGGGSSMRCIDGVWTLQEQRC